MTMSTALKVALPSGDLRIADAHDGVYDIRDLCEFASRLNPKRAFLFVSKVLGKHLPARPGAMLGTHTELSNQVAHFIEPGEPAVFIGFAETATGLGAGVFEGYCRQAGEPNSLFVQTTRYHLPHPVALHFKEEHSHATGHLVYEPLVGKDIFYGAKTLVLVDDELTTGKTNANFLKAFLERVNSGVQNVILVSLVNWMSREQRNQFANAFPHLSVTFCSLFNGGFEYD
ncbi:phosphoribosyltransferase domain-containing protein, partial [Nostoc sp. CHAB 5834]|nr:phosphoribosyltransferase domain-containing protein [Nostoc sp. CHAB 5834]